MKSICKVLGMAVLVALVAGSAWGAQIAPSHQGNALIFPVYAAAPAAGNSWETHIEVINTSDTESCRAKVVFRGALFSQELRDFFIYLSPTDVWTARVYNAGGGITKVFSDDGSVQVAPGMFASPSNPLDINLVNDPCDLESFGYIMVYVDYYNDDVEEPFGDTDVPPVAKSDILAATQAADADFGAENFNDITGYFELRLNGVNLNSMANAVAIEDYDINQELTLGAETRLGQFSDTSIAEVEALLAKDVVELPFYFDGQNISAHMFTFPTKLAEIDSDCDVVGSNVDSPFFEQNTSSSEWCVEYGLKYFDLEENTPGEQSPIFSPTPPEESNFMCNELQIETPNTLGVQSGFPRGWVRYDFAGVGNSTSVCVENFNPCYQYVGNPDLTNFTGAPVIPMVLHLGADGMALTFGAYDDSNYSFGSCD